MWKWSKNVIYIRVPSVTCRDIRPDDIQKFIYKSDPDSVEVLRI